MKSFKIAVFGLSIALQSTNLSAQQTNKSDSLTINPEIVLDSLSQLVTFKSANNDIASISSIKKWKYVLPTPTINTEKRLLLGQSDNSFFQTYNINLGLGKEKKKFFHDNRRNRYSSLWAFTSLNYLYADQVGLMDKNILNQYQTGIVNGTKITPNFLTAAAGFMQIPLCNVFLPQVIKNERTLRWVQIASGTIMTLVQSGTLFVGKPTPYYILFSAIEIGTTAYITIDAIKWKPKKKIKIVE